MIAICLATPDELPALIRDMQQRGRNRVSCAFALVRMGYFETIEDALRAVCRYFVP